MFNITHSRANMIFFFLSSFQKHMENDVVVLVLKQPVPPPLTGIVTFSLSSSEKLKDFGFYVAYVRVKKESVLCVEERMRQNFQNR